MSFDVHTYDLLVAGRLVTGTLVGALRAIAHLAILGAPGLAGRLDLQTAVISYAGVHAAAAAGARRSRPGASCRACRRPRRRRPGRRSRASRAASCGCGWIGQLSAVSYLLLLRLDQGFLEFGHGAAAVGIYSVAVWAAEMLWLLPEAINPLLVHASADETRPRGARRRGGARRARGRSP